jgi:tetratricopeptide (TPR) repeat protein
VGIDQYGLVFKKYRDLQYPLNYGFEITSSNAHSIPLQLLATGGIFVGFLYLALMGYIFIQGIRTIYLLKSNERYLLTGVFSAWLGFQAQAMISIENIGLGIWSWIFGGIIIGIAKSTKNITEIEVLEKVKSFRQEKNLKLLQPIFSGVLVFVSILFIAPLYTGEMDTMKSRSFYDPANQTQSKEFYIYSEKAITNRFNDPYYKLIVLEMMLQSDGKDRALIYLKNLHLQDPKNLDFLRPLAIVYEQNGDFNEAIKYRKLIESEDPWNLDNYLRLGYLYKKLGDIRNMSIMLEKITSVAPNHIIAITAKQQLST